MTDLVFIDGNRVVTDSLTIAEVFKKEHKHVVRDIENQISKLEEASEQDFVKSNFGLETFKAANNKEAKKFTLTEDAFTLVAMSYTTPEAMKMKVKFIQEFKRMRKYIEKQQPKSQLEILQLSINQLVEQEKRLNEQEAKIEAIEEKQNNITEILSLNNNDWRNKINRILNAIAMKLGGGQYFQELRAESYELLEKRANCLLNKRLENRKSKMALRGQSKTAISKLSKLDVIGEDKKLVSVYVTVIKEMAVKYQLNLADYQLVESEY